MDDEDATFRRTKPAMRKNNKNRNKFRNNNKNNKKGKPKRGDNVFGAPYSSDGDEIMDGGDGDAGKSS